LAKKGILFVGSGVSGGEEGARNGPSLMPGGNKEAWTHIKDIFQVSFLWILNKLYKSLSENFAVLDHLCPSWSRCLL